MSFDVLLDILILKRGLNKEPDKLQKSIPEAIFQTNEISKGDY